MDTAHVAALLRTLTTAPSRRDLLATVPGGLLAIHSLANGGDAEARKNRKRRKKRKDRKPKIRKDASCSGSFQSNLFAGAGNPRFAQTFTPNATGPLVRVDLLVLKVPGTDGDWVLRLAPVDGAGFPTNEVLAETSVLDAQVPDDESIVTFTFPEPATVRARGQYALVVTRPGSTSLGLGGQLDAECAIQAFTSPDQTSAFIQDRPDFDFIFTTFVRS